MARRLYLGKLPHDVRQEELTKFFEGYGRIVDCRVMTGFGFVEFESSRVKEVVAQFNGKNFMGQPIVVEFAKEGRSRPRENFDDRGRPPGIRLIVSGVSRETSWQDLKDFGREAGSVSFADIDRDVPGQGILEYLNRDDADNAIKTLNGKDLRGQSVTVALAEEGAGGSSSLVQRDYRRDDRDRRDDHRDRFRDAPRRDRSRSPRRDRDRDSERYDDRRFDDRRRSPPPRREDDRRYDDRRDSRRDDRRDDKRDDDRKDDRRGDDRRDDRRNGDSYPRGGGR
ncbi:hypothetical protein M422DRAFT_168262 [Sphaerobolus stellatus SS14]|uniref:RRM domain-containing protein n=1 Tax=Sphaerobolus stellatus (strain SS14) TaxID=990650 RepID=A0A0C9VBE3_SPHS4|nr:hypothetical protein M422DRAFT_168262 [Sphaerobolus stellatus SS14]